MQGFDLKAARAGLGLSQEELAMELGMSRVMIGLMERGVKDIEKRTELAVRYLLIKAGLED